MGFKQKSIAENKRNSSPVPWPALTGIGLLAGFSSGFLGIGGGLAITAGLSAGQRVPQHQAQLVSLVFSTIPTTVPAAWIYWRNGWSAPWFLIAGVVVGFWAGTDFGARMANHLGETALHLALLCFVTAMAIYMAYRAMTRLGSIADGLFGFVAEASRGWLAVYRLLAPVPPYRCVL